MFRLYSVLHQRPEPPTAEEIDIASGKKVLDATAAKTYFKDLEITTENIIRSMALQRARTTVCSYHDVVLHASDAYDRVIGIKQSLNDFCWNG